MTTLAHDFIALAAQRETVNLNHVVEHAGKYRDDLAVLVPVEAGLFRKRVFHEPGQVD